MAEFDMVGHIPADHTVLHNMAEDLKTPLTRILIHSQLSEAGQSLDARYLSNTADSAIRLIDSYLFSSQIYNNQQRLVLQPTSISAVMQDVSYELSRFARQQNVQIEVLSSRKAGLVMAHAKALHAALSTLTYSFLTGSHNQKSKITMKVENRKNGVICGVFDSQQQLAPETLQSIRTLRGRASRLSAQLPHGTSSGLIIADGVFEAMGSQLKVASCKHGKGLVAQFVPSTQLALL